MSSSDQQQNRVDLFAESPSLLGRYTKMLMEWHEMPSLSTADQWARAEKHGDIEKLRSEVAQDFLLGFTWACDKFPAKMRNLLLDLVPELALERK